MIREFQAGDLEPLIDIWRNASKELYGSRSSEEWRELEQYTRNYIEWFTTFVYLLDGKPVGFITLSDCEVLLLFLAPENQERGLGGELIKFVKSIFDHLKLKVHSRNERALKFYQRRGFRVCGKAVPDSFGNLQRIMWWRYRRSG